MLFRFSAFRLIRTELFLSLLGGLLARCSLLGRLFSGLQFLELCLEMKDKEITRLKARLEKLEPAEEKPKAKKAPAKRKAANKENAEE